MSGSCYQELGTNGDVSSSDDDSVSLLSDKKVHKNTSGVKDGENGQSHPQGVIVSSWSRIPGKSQIHKRNENGETLLFKACRRKDLAQVKMLIQAGIDVNVTDYAGWTALHDAAAAGDETVVKELLKAGANINVQGLDGSMPLHDAVFCGHYQVMKLFLQFGSSYSDRNIRGLTALEMAEKNIIDLLPSLQTFPGLKELSTDQKQAEHSYQTRLFCKTGLRPQRSSLTNVPSRASGDTEGAREPGDIQLRKKDRAGNAITVVLDAMGRIQTDMLSWPLKSPEDEGRYSHVLTQIENVLNKVLITQHLEKEKLSQKSQGVCGVRRLMWKNQVVALVSRQKDLVKILEKQIKLIQACLNMTAKISGHHQNSTVVEEQNRLENSCQPRKVQGNSPRVDHFRHTVTEENIPLESQCNKQIMSVLRLLKSGVTPPGGFSVLVKGKRYSAHVNNDGSITDQEGKLHLTPEQWLESVYGNNVHVSSQCNKDKVVLREKYLSSMESEKSTPHTHSASSQRRFDTGADNLTCLMKIKTINLVDDEEMLPNSVVDYHWEKLLKTDYSVTDGWDG